MNFFQGQLRYVRHYCEVLREALDFGDDGDVVIDMDAVADAVGKEGEKAQLLRVRAKPATQIYLQSL